MVGTALCPSATKVLLCGAGELGKEVAIELQRLGVEVIAVDRYPNAPAMQVAHRSHVISMLDGESLRRVVEQERPDVIVPEIEAIATETLRDLESEGFRVIPTAEAAWLTMNREGIRRLVAEELQIPTSSYRFANSLAEVAAASDEVGFPCVIKPIMSSSGKGQSTVKSPDGVEASWDYAQSGGRTGAGRVIVEGFVDFEYEITLLTVRSRDGESTKTTYLVPVGHRQVAGDYVESWQPQPMSPLALERAQQIAGQVTGRLGGLGLFGVELFVKCDDVWFSEVSPRPHDTGLVTLISQDLSEFALHARAILGLPIPGVEFYGPSASAALLVDGESDNVRYSGLDEALAGPGTALRLFGKPEVSGHRRMGVGLARGATVDEARAKARNVVAKIRPELG